jgi:hypothetical protein
MLYSGKNPVGSGGGGSAVRRGEFRVVAGLPRHGASGTELV